MPGLLVSVRSVEEARIAVATGATVIDIKEPSRGPLGRASVEVWKAVRAAVPRATPVSVALGELHELEAATEPLDWTGISFRKVGLAAERIDWADRWAAIRARHPGPPWIATIYADWNVAQSPPPREIVDIALSIPDCIGFLIDTWDKSRPNRLDDSWFPLVARAKAAGRLVTLAGGLDANAIRRLAPLGPDLFGVRSAVCVAGDRGATLDPARVADLVQLTASLKF